MWWVVERQRFSLDKSLNHLKWEKQTRCNTRVGVGGKAKLTEVAYLFYFPALNHPRLDEWIWWWTIISSVKLIYGNLTIPIPFYLLVTIIIGCIYQVRQSYRTDGCGWDGLVRQDKTVIEFINTSDSDKERFCRSLKVCIGDLILCSSIALPPLLLPDR